MRLGVANNSGVFDVLIRCFGPVLLEFPCGADNLLLQFHQARGLITLHLLALLIFLVLSPRLGLALTENLVERTHFGEIDVAVLTANLAVRADVIGPDVIGYKIVRFHTQILESKGMGKSLFLRTGNGTSELDDFNISAPLRIGQAIGMDSKVVPDLAEG